MHKIKVYNSSGNPLPKYAKEGDSGMDVRASKAFNIRGGDTAIVPTGLYVALPGDYCEIQVRPRSGLSANTKLRVANAPGTVDSNYLGELCIIVDNIGVDPININVGDRIAQIVLVPVLKFEFDEVERPENLGDSNRGINGFGSTGIE